MLAGAMTPKISRQGAFLERQAESNTTISSLQAENDALRTESEALRTDNDFLREQVAIMAEHTKAHAALKRAVAKLRPEVETHKQQIREADMEHTKSLSFFMSTFM
jgi:seryl-tRNA synthetase